MQPEESLVHRVEPKEPTNDNNRPVTDTLPVENRRSNRGKRVRLVLGLSSKHRCFPPLDDVKRNVWTHGGTEALPPSK